MVDIGLPLHRFSVLTEEGTSSQRSVRLLPFAPPISWFEIDHDGSK